MMAGCRYERAWELQSFTAAARGAQTTSRAWQQWARAARARLEGLLAVA